MLPYGLFLCNQAGRLINQQLLPDLPLAYVQQAPPKLPGGPWQPHATKSELVWEFIGRNQTLTRLLEPINVHPIVRDEPDQPCSLILTTKVVHHHVTDCQATLLTPEDARYHVNTLWEHARQAAKPAEPVSYGKPTFYSLVRKFWYQPAPHTRINVITLDYPHLPASVCPQS